MQSRPSRETRRSLSRTGADAFIGWGEATTGRPIGLYILTDDDFVALAPDATASDPEPERALGEFIDRVSGTSSHADLIEPVDAPDAPAALACVEMVLERAARTLEVPVPEVRWFRPWPSPSTKTIPRSGTGFVIHCDSVVWLSVAYTTPQGLAVTVAHEVVHYWQDHRRGRCLDEVEHSEREGEARRRAKLLVNGRFITPRGRKRDEWFEPARRRYGPA